MKLKYILSLTALAAVLLIQPNTYAQKKTNRKLDKHLIGKWHTEKVALSPTLLKIDFGKKGDFDYKLTQTWEGHYKQSGTSLVTTYTIPYLNKTTKDTSLILIIADTLIIQEKVKGKEEDFRFLRAGHDRGMSGGLMGKWISANYKGYKAEVEYSKSGGFKMVETLREIRGNYIIEGEYFTVFSNREEMMHMRYKVFPKHDMLMIYNNKGKWMRLERDKRRK